jgi:lipopolysaccharide/colanic/teichoic acid biosynthesis glycosyltransferase
MPVLSSFLRTRPEMFGGRDLRAGVRSCSSGARMSAGCRQKTGAGRAGPPGLPWWFNRMAAALGICLLAPLLLLVWLLVRLDSDGPALFRQARTGLGGRRFTCYKFRTMSAGDDSRPQQILNFDTFVFSPKGEPRDPRLTRLGIALRATSVDELPQLLNVLAGEMALIGPRPELPEIVAQYPPAYHERHLVPPGISGLAQVNGRSDLPYGEIAAWDLAYVRQRSPLLDLRLLWETVAVVAGGAGAR